MKVTSEHFFVFLLNQYSVFSNEKVSTLLTQLSWSHYLLLISLNDYDEIIYYINISKANNLTQRELQDKIKNNEYKRLSNESRNKLIDNKRLELNELLPNPIIIKDNNKHNDISEKLLQRLILEDVSLLLKELGEGFTFVDNEYTIKIDDRYNYIDLLLYNIRYKCYS